MASARRIVMFNRVTADGYFSAPGGGPLDWVVPDDEVDQAGAAAIPNFDTILFGRRTYEMFAAFWPRIAEDPGAADPHDPRRRSPQLRAFATMLTETPKLVFSRSLREGALTWKASRLAPALEPGAIEALKRQPGKDMIIFGSGTIVSLLTQHGLIDEYQLVVTPAFLGSGVPLIRDVPRRTRLELLDAKPYRSGNVVLRYARAG